MPRIVHPPTGRELDVPPQAVHVHLIEGWQLVEEDEEHAFESTPEPFGPDITDPEPEEG